MPSGEPSIRIILTVHRDREALASLLPELLCHWQADELHVVDTGDDDAAAVAAARGVPCLVVDAAQRGRARQMNAGAKLHPEADLLLFLHADTRLPPAARASLVQAYREGAVGGGFSRRFDSPSRFLRLSCALADWRVRRFGLAFGDQAIFVRRDVFDRLGGFPDQPLFEDWDFTRLLRKQGPTRLLTPGVISSARRFEQDGPVLRTFKDLWLTVCKAIN
ncbi:MAG: glycosyltransferase [Verrucomicrobia bacterium]|nr:glycosyltransferase [Verrucomicrobiota bacterium]MCH8527709.1 glycosyltransferase [Kiritimatiellia bacterium]